MVSGSGEGRQGRLNSSLSKKYSVTLNCDFPFFQCTVCVCVCVCVCVLVCVRESVCDGVCVCVAASRYMWPNMCFYVVVWLYVCLGVCRCVWVYV